MINKDLIDYVRIQRSNGLSKEAITQALAAGGWNPNDVSEAFMALDGVSVQPPPPAPAPAPTPAAAPTPASVTPAAQPVQPLQPPVQSMPPQMQQPNPLQPRTIIPPVVGTQMPVSTPPVGGVTITQNPPPIAAASEYSTVIIKKKSHLMPILIIVLILMLIGGGVFYVSMNPSVITATIENFFPASVPVDDSLNNPEPPMQNTSINPEAAGGSVNTSTESSSTLPVTGPNVFR